METKEITRDFVNHIVKQLQDYIRKLETDDYDDFAADKMFEAQQTIKCLQGRA